MLTKYTLIHVPSGGVDHLLNGVRVRINYRMTNEQADQLKAQGLPYFQEKQTIESDAQINQSSGENAESTQGPANGPGEQPGTTGPSQSGTSQPASPARRTRIRKSKPAVK